MYTQNGLVRGRGHFQESLYTLKKSGKPLGLVYTEGYDTEDHVLYQKLLVT